VTSFVGRRDEVLSARGLLAESRLVTLTGIGGVGKTRLALRVAAAAARAFPDGVWLVELDQLTDETLLAQTVAEAVGLRELRGPSAMRALADHLADRQLLLVVDNCEHLVDAVAKLLETLLRGSARLRILATSRTALDIEGEFLLAVPSLSRPASTQAMPVGKLASFEAIALFVERARAVQPAFELTERNAGAVVEICSRLDGLPLAIELAAARLRVLSADQINDRLQDRFALLTRGPRNVPTRQQTLHACIEWSFDLCSRAEQQMWARLSVFAGGFELDAVQDICADEGQTREEVLELVATLLAKSIITAERTGTTVRYRMLESISGYGAERLQASGEELRLRRRHHDWYEQLVLQARRDWIGPRQVQWLQRLEREHPNIRLALRFSLIEPGQTASALRICAALHSYWLVRGLTSEGRQWLEQALAQPSEPDRDRLTATFTATILAAVQGDLVAANALARQVEDIAARIGDRWSQAIADLATGGVALHAGNPALAAALDPPALEVFQAEGDLYWTVMALAGLAMVTGFMGDSRAATTYYTSLLAITHSRGEVRLQSLAAWALGVGLWKDGDVEQAADRLKDSLRLRRRMNDTFGTALCLDALAWIAADARHAHRAAILLGVVAALERAMGSPAATYPALLTYHEQCEWRVREALGDSAFRAALARGGQLSLDEAIAYSLDDDLDQPAARAVDPAPGSGDGSPSAGTVSSLTRRERQIGELIAEGLSNREIADRLFLSKRTVEGHVQNVLTKLGAGNRAQIAALMVQQGPDLES